jgi:2-amino-4-hydroxy-6-hydroxymethyldihydropteridine diphosphokinase
VALGSNLGEREAHLALARERLGALPTTRFVAASAVEETAPLGDLPQDAYLNQMVALDTALEPEALLDACLAIEREAGRDRASTRRWGPRTLDLDVVLFGTRTVDSPRLRVPHPELPRRAFWQRELAMLGVEWAAAMHAAADAATNAAGARRAAASPDEVAR